MASAEIEEIARELSQLLARYDALDRVALGEPGRTAQRRDQLRDVAARFPGALRELDAIGVDGVRARRATVAALLDEVRATGSTSAVARSEHDWVRATLALMPRLRLVLDIKAWLAEHAPGQGLAAAGARERVRACYPDADDDLLDRIASPPKRQVQQVAYQDAARDLGVDVDQLKRILYGD